MILLLSLVACGEFVCLPAGDALENGVAVSFSSELDLSKQTSLRHYGLDALLRFSTASDAGPLDGRGVDYTGISESTEATGALSSYLAALSTVNPSELSTQEERLAFWLNTYNAWILYGVSAKVAENPDYTVESDGWLLFSTQYIPIAGFSISPNDLEHGILRGWADQPYGNEALAAQAAQWHIELWEGEAPDARLHMGLNCASASCPDIPPGAFQGTRLWEQLDDQATAFLDNPKKGAGPDGISTIFSWFGSDFESSFGSSEAFIEAYRTKGTTGVAMQALLPYDWALNKATAAAGEATCGSPW
jgi:hypothetical protein